MAYPPEAESSTISQPEEKTSAIQAPFRTLSNRVTQLHWRWQLFNQLYVTGQRRIDLLNEIAGGFFHEIQWIMRDDLVLSTARLLDRNRDTLSLFRLLELLGQTTAHRLIPGLRVELEAIEGKAGPFLALRDTKIAHLEYEPRRPKVDELLLPGIGPDLIDEVLWRIANFMNTIQSELEGGTTAYAAVSSLSDGDTLIHGLRKAADWKDIVREVSAVVGQRDIFAQHERLKKDRYHDIEKSRDWYSERGRQ